MWTYNRPYFTETKSINYKMYLRPSEAVKCGFSKVIELIQSANSFRVDSFILHVEIVGCASFIAPQQYSCVYNPPTGGDNWRRLYARVRIATKKRYPTYQRNRQRVSGHTCIYWYIYNSTPSQQQAANQVHLYLFVCVPISCAFVCAGCVILLIE